MKTHDLFKLSINSLFHRRLRSWLTIIGIIIGVAAVVALVSIGEGIQESVQSQLSILGGDIIFVSPSSSRATTTGGFDGSGLAGGFTSGGTRSGNLTQNDLKLIQSVPGIQSVDGVINERADIKYINEVSTINIQGVNAGVWKYFVTSPLAAGRYLIQGDSLSVVLGHNPANTLFTKPVNVNSMIQINGQNFRVVGILEQSGSSSLDNVVVMPIESARRVFTDIADNQFSALLVKTTSTENVPQVAEDIENRLFVSHHVTKDSKDFTVISTQSISQTVGQVTGAITFFLGSIAAISLLVGGIGIANTMFMSVIERTRQIGIMKALGATSNDVMRLFIVESALIGLVGGVIGVAFGVVASQAISFLGSQGGSAFTTAVSLQIVLIAVGFSVVIGVLSGVLPARQAANLDPVQALSYE
ncbi:ABC transporter permease [archaeon]|nr:MAG: ABC transporter permease [archaeon]